MPPDDVFLSALLFSSFHVLCLGQQITHIAPTTPGQAAATSSPTYGESPNSGEDPTYGLTPNYWFILIAVSVCVLVIVYIYIVRRRRRTHGRLRAGGQLRPSLADRNVWFQGVPHGSAMRDARPEEGLNEQGEAPPPYVPGQFDTSGGGARQAFETHYMGKPPDYEPGTNWGGELDLMRPPATHPPADGASRAWRGGGAEEGEGSRQANV
jgi:hypothetical protein